MSILITRCMFVRYAYCCLIIGKIMRNCIIQSKPHLMKAREKNKDLNLLIVVFVIKNVIVNKNIKSICKNTNHCQIINAKSALWWYQDYVILKSIDIKWFRSIKSTFNNNNRIITKASIIQLTSVINARFNINLSANWLII